MKTVSVRDLQKSIRECMEMAQAERVVVTKRGRPAAVVIGVEGQDWEQVALRLSPAFWTMVEQRRREPTVALAEAKRRLEALWKKPKRASTKARTRRKATRR